MSDPKQGDLKVWWIPQVPMEAFEVPVRSIREAKLVLATLASYDLFQLNHHIKPDYSNVGGLMAFDPNEVTSDGENDGWVDWFDEDGNDIDSTQEGR